jgi:PAS domain-containing protein
MFYQTPVMLDCGVGSDRSGLWAARVRTQKRRLRNGVPTSTYVRCHFAIWYGRTGSRISQSESSQPVLLYSLLPFLLWSVLRFGLMGISTSIIVVAFLSIWGAVHGLGPFAGAAPLSNVMSLQLFLFFADTPFMVLAVLVEEHKQAQQALSEGEERFRLIANSAPVLIWMSGTNKLCTYFNAPCLDFTGRPLEAELGNGVRMRERLS